MIVIEFLWVAPQAEQENEVTGFAMSGLSGRQQVRASALGCFWGAEFSYENSVPGALPQTPAYFYPEEGGVVLVRASRIDSARLVRMQVVKR